MELFDKLWQEIIVAIVLATGAGIFAWLRRRNSKVKELEKEVQSLQRFRYRITKTIIVLSKLIDSQVEEVHHGIKSEMEEIVKELLDTEHFTTK